MSNRSLTSTLRSIGRLNGQSARPLVPSPSRRQFCTSPVHGVRAIFAETENDELNIILRTIQEKIILPAYLPDKQRKLVFNPKMRSHLEQNPVVIEVEGLEHKFSSIDRFKGIENSKTILNKALRNMKSPEDWNNLGTLLAGYRKAGVRLKANSWGRIVRTAGKSGNIYAVIECAKQADKTGLVFANRETVVRVLAYINDKITNNSNPEGNEEVAKQALKWSEIVLDLVQRPEHVVSGQSTRQRLHFSRLVRGMTLFTRASAYRAKAAGEGAAEGDLVLLKDEVELLSSLWKDSVNEDLLKLDEFAKLNPTLERNSSPKGARIPQALNGSAYVQVLAQNIKGIALAREMLGEEAQALAPVEVALSDHLRQFVQTSQSSTKDWDQEYEKIVGYAPNW